MHLDWLYIKQVRNLTEIKFPLAPGVNLFTGRNGSGKTAILEAAYLLARAKSFRTPRIKEVIQRNTTFLQVSAGADAGKSHTVTTGIEKSHGRTIIRYAGNPVKTVSEQARNLPTILITPDTATLVTGTPKHKRHWLDWAMFHVEPGYLDAWQDYFKALRQRNSLLKEKVNRDEQYSIWENIMLKRGEYLRDAREAFISSLESLFQRLITRAFPGYEFSVELSRGWPQEIEYESYLKNERNKDFVAGYTRYGSHRADILFFVDGVPVEAVFSRGQIKLFACLLKVAEASLFAQINNDLPVILLDDFSAELDREAQQLLLEELLRQKNQVFLTCVDQQGFAGKEDIGRVFHVERGSLTKMVE